MLQNSKKMISVVTPCYNEEGNIVELHDRIKAVFQALPQYDYEHIYIDNASTDQTIPLIRELCKQNAHVKLIINARNFGHIRSPVHGLMQANGDAAILIASDLQDPPELIAEFIKNWEIGFKVVIAVKNESDESPLFYAVRKLYYNSLAKISDIALIKNYTGTGLYDRKVLEVLKQIDDPYPYFRGLIAELGFKRKIVNFKQPIRKRGFSKNNFFTLYDIGMLGIVSHSRVPLRMATMTGFMLSVVCFFVSLAYVIAKLVFWNQFSLGLAPLLVGFFFMSSIQLFFIGIIGEYVGTIFTQVQKRPLVIEDERVNFKS